MTNEEKDKKEYELALLLKTEENLAGVVAMVGSHNGEGLSEPRAKRLQLAYEIKKVNEGVFVYFTFKMYADDMKALEHELNSAADVLRFMVIASPAPAERPSAGLMPQREERRSRNSSSSHSSSSPAPAPVAEAPAPKVAPSRPLSNEALEKKIEEILK
jgi:ribosomal protein S6